MASSHGGTGFYQSLGALHLPDGQTRTAVAVCVILLLAVALVFGRTVGHEFLFYDDGTYVYENPQVAKGLTARGFAWAFTTTHADNWHPLTWLSLMLDAELYGLNPAGFHLTNLLLHAASSILLFLLLWRMTGFLWRSAFVAAVFAVHPLRVESVAWVAERKDVLSGLFFMLTLLSYLRYVRRPFSHGRYWTVVGLFALGLMSKPMLVTLPFVLLLLDYWPLGRLSSESGACPGFPRRVVVEKIPLLILSAASCIATFIAQGNAMMPAETIPAFSRMANALISYVAYIGKFLYPVGLAVFYPHPVSVPPGWQVAGSVLMLAVITAAAMIWRRRFPWLLVGWLWYLGMLVPVIGLIQVGSHALADRYTYLPQIGLILSIVWGISVIPFPRPHRLRVCCVLSVLILLLLMGLAWRQTSYWKNNETLWTRALACTEGNHVALNNLGMLLANQGRLYEAVAFFQQALDIRSTDIEARDNLGNALAELGMTDAAIAQYRKILEIKPDFADAHFNLGIALEERGQIEEAILHYRRALESNPNLAAAHYKLGVLAADRARLDEAVAHFQKALTNNPDDAEARYFLDRLMRAQKQRASGKSAP